MREKRKTKSQTTKTSATGEPLLGTLCIKSFTKKTSIKNMLITFCPLTCNVRVTSYKKEKKHYIIRNNRNLDIYGKKQKTMTHIRSLNKYIHNKY